MPRIHRVCLANIGHPRAFMEKLVIKCWGENTVVLAENGGGKSSIIALILAVLRPSKYEFLQGETEEKRRQEDYIPFDYPAHVMIEWLLDTPNRREFLLTGMILLKRAGKDLRRMFYSLNYSEELLDSSDTITFDNFPLESETGYLSHDEILKRLDRQKRLVKTQRVQIIRDGNISKWQNHLDSNYIDTELARAQLRMNKREEAQAEFLTFTTDQDFVKFITAILQPLPEKKDLHMAEIKDSYKDMNKLPALRKEKEFAEQIHEKLVQGLGIEQETTNYYMKKEDLFKCWTRLHLICQKKRDTFDKEIQNNKSVLERQEPNLKSKKVTHADLSLQIPFLNRRIIQLQIKDNEKTIQEQEALKRSHEKTRNLLDVLPDYLEWQQESSRCHMLEAQLSEQVQPLRKSLIIAKQILAYLFNQTIAQQEIRRKEKQDKLTSTQQLLNKHQNDRGAGKERLKTLEKSIADNQREFRKIEEEEQKIREQTSWQDYESLDEARERLLSDLKKITAAQARLKEEIDKTESSLKELTTEIETITDEKNEDQKEQAKIQQSLVEIQNRWQKIIENPLFTFFFGTEWKDSAVNYSLLQKNMERITKEEKSIHEQLMNKNHDYSVLTHKLDVFKNKGAFPYDPEIEILKEYLKKEQISVFIGWDYLKNSIGSVEERRIIVKKLPYLLEGIIVLEPNLERINKVLEKILADPQLLNLTKPVFISIPSVLKDPPLLNQNVLCVKPGLDWRFDTAKAKEHFDKVTGQHKKEEQRLTNIKDQFTEIQRLSNSWRDFLEDYPEKTFNELQEQLRSLNLSINEQENTLGEKKRQRKQLETNKISLTQELNDLEREKGETTDQKNTLDVFVSRYERMTKLQYDETKFTQEHRKTSDELQGLERLIPELEKQKANLQDEIQQLQERLTENQRQLRRYASQEINPEDKMTASEINQKTEEKTLGEWITLHNEFERQYTTQFSDSELRYSITSLQEKNKQRMKELTQQCNHLKLQIEELDQFSQKHSSLSNKTTILIRKGEEEQQIEHCINIIQDKANDNKTLRKASKEQLDKYLPYIEELKTKYGSMLIDKDIKTLREGLKTLEQREEALRTKIEKLESEIKEANENLIFAQTQKEETGNQLKIIEPNIRLVAGVELSTEAFSELSRFDPLQISLEEIKDQVSTYDQETEKFSVWEKNLTLKTQDYVEDFRKLAPDAATNLQETGLFRFVKNFDKAQIRQITSFKEHIENRLTSLEEKIKSPTERLENISLYFTTIIHDVLSKLKKLSSIKLEIRDLPHLDNKPIIKIRIDEDNEELAVKRTVKNYFHRLFASYEEFPDTLTFEQILYETLVDYLQEGRLKPIKYLFPETKQEASYKDIREIRKASGGERVTIGILLYCLIAYFRLIFMSQEQKGKRTQSFPLIMDNPFGKASRLDFIKLQVSLAEKLKIQLIPFTAINEVEILHHYKVKNTLKVELRRREDGKDLSIVTIDPEETKAYSLSSGSVKVRPSLPQMSPKPEP